MYKYSNTDLLRSAIENSHTICNKLSVQEAIAMKEKDVRNFPDEHKITEREKQDTYLNILRLYEFMIDDHE